MRAAHVYLLIVLCTLTALAETPWFDERPRQHYDPERRISIEFKNDDLVYVLKVLAKEMNRNIFVGPSVEGTVTLKIRELTVEEAIRRVLALSGKKYDYKIVKTTVIVATPDKLAEIPDDILDDDCVKECVVAPWTSPQPLPPRARAGFLGDLPIIGTLFRHPSVPAPANTEEYDPGEETGFQRVEDYPLSTFSADVDTASYSNVRRFLNLGQFPPPDAVRLEEMVNYFRYDYPQPKGTEPFSITTEVSDCPWAPKHKLLRIGVQGRTLPEESLPPRNLVFLIDVSGSMDDPYKLPLVTRSMRLLLNTLNERDRVAIVVYAGASGVVLGEPTPGDRREAILEALELLHAGGSTNGGQGLLLAYKLARQNFDPAAVNRVILATDGDFNVGITRREDLIRLIESQRESGVFLSVLGFGSGNLKDSQMEQLADKGNGNYSYIDSLSEARRVLVQEGQATLVTLAKDVKFQVEFNPLEVSDYRLIGYENRRLQNEDFSDDRKDAADLGPGHSVTVFYELVPEASDPGRHQLRYQGSRQPTPAARGGGLALVKLRYKLADQEVSHLTQVTVRNADRPFLESSPEHRFSASVVAFGLLLHESEYSGAANYEKVARWARSSVGHDADGHRRELVGLIELAAGLAARPGAVTATVNYRGGLIRQEFILNQAPASDVLHDLSRRYARVKFIDHPTMNGFYAVGSTEEVLQIKRELPSLDLPPGPPVKEVLRVKHSDAGEMRILLAALVPEVSYLSDDRLNLLMLEGQPRAVEAAKELLGELDRPLPDKVR